MGLDDFIEDSKDKGPEIDFGDSDHSEDAQCCPRCGQPGEDTGHWYYRCTAPSSKCETITFIPTR